MGWLDNALMAARRGERGPLRHARKVWRALVGIRLPVIRPLIAPIYGLWTTGQWLGPLIMKVFFREPLMRYRCQRVGCRLRLSGQLPMIIGNGRIELGDDVTIDTRNTWIVGFKISTDPVLVVGNRVFIGYQTVLSVAKRIEIGDDTMIAGNVQVFDNISHPLSPSRRLRGESFTLDESKPVVIGRNVWIGNGVHVMRGVTIGDNSVVAAGSVVVRSVPANVVVAGYPATVIMGLAETPSPIVEPVL